MIDFSEVTNYTNPKFKSFFDSTSRDIVLYGGAGAGKSYAVADKLALEILDQEETGVKLKFMVIRKSLPSMKKTCIPIIRQSMEKFGIDYHLNKQDMIAEVGQRSEIYYVSANNREDYEKIKSITDVDFIWIEEANEINYQVYAEIIKLRLRGGQGKYAQRIFTFNPISKFIWIYDYHFVQNFDKSEKINVTISDNKFRDAEYEKELNDLQYLNYNLYSVYALGKFGTLEGIIYPDIGVTNTIPKTANKIYGIDFGFNNPSAVLEISIVDDVYYEKQLIYERGLTNRQLIDKLNLIIPKDHRKRYFFADSAEPDRIKEFRDEGYNIYPAKKDVKLGIDHCHRKKILMHNESSDLIKENQTYSWAQNKDGQKIDEPVKHNDHLMDCRRYAIYSYENTILTEIDKAITISEKSEKFQY